VLLVRSNIHCKRFERNGSETGEISTCVPRRSQDLCVEKGWQIRGKRKRQSKNVTKSFEKSENFFSKATLKRKDPKSCKECAQKIKFSPTHR
jgi:hypothetical protein